MKKWEHLVDGVIDGGFGGNLASTIIDLTGYFYNENDVKNQPIQVNLTRDFRTQFYSMSTKHLVEMRINYTLACSTLFPLSSNMAFTLPLDNVKTHVSKTRAKISLALTKFLLAKPSKTNF